MRFAQAVACLFYAERATTFLQILLLVLIKIVVLRFAIYKHPIRVRRAHKPARQGAAKQLAVS
ncbi:MAG: hypothetical protein Q4F84_06165, partial [Fibrobacter sp.]|nr:hypothetical protein [Fibrobacter sp.]